MLAPASAVQLKKIGKPAGGNFAYITLNMNPKAVPQEVKMTDVMTEAEEAEYIKNDAALKAQVEEGTALKTKTQEEALIPPGGSKMYGPDMIFGIDDQLRNAGAKYPYIVVTNDPRLITDPRLNEHPNMKIVKVGDDVSFLALKGKVAMRNKLHVQKLSIFNMTQYDKLISLDQDIKVMKNIDHIFTDPEFDTANGDRVYGMSNAQFDCTNGKQHYNGDYFNSAVMLLEPKPNTFDAIMEFAHHRSNFWGDQAIIQTFFQKERKRPEIFPIEIADFVDCKNRIAKKQPDVVHLR
jgi:hypothetical protein